MEFSADQLSVGRVLVGIDPSAVALPQSRLS